MRTTRMGVLELPLDFFIYMKALPNGGIGVSINVTDFIIRLPYDGYMFYIKKNARQFFEL